MEISKLAPLCLVALIFSCAGDQPIPRTMNYDQAIEEALLTSNGDRTYELHRCISNWQIHAKRRQLFLNELAKNRVLDHNKIMLLEIGNANYPRYEYLYIVDDLLNASGIQLERERLSISGTSLKGKIESLNKADITSLRGHVSADIDDGDCYFLTVGKRSTFKQVAIYGSLPDTNKAGALIREAIKAIKGARL